MRFDIGKPDLWDEVDEAIDRIQEPIEASLSVPTRKVASEQ